MVGRESIAWDSTRQMVVAYCRLSSEPLRRGETIFMDSIFLSCMCSSPITQKIIEKASGYFQLDAMRPDLVLHWELDGEEMEVTNDILGLLPDGTTLTLFHIPRRNALHQSWHSLAKSAKSWGNQGHFCPGGAPVDRLSFSGLPPKIPEPAGMFVWVKT